MAVGIPILLIDMDFVSVVHIHSIACADPDQSPLILVEAHYGIVGKLFFDCQVFEHHILRILTAKCDKGK